MQKVKIEIADEGISRTYGDNTYYSQVAYLHQENERYPRKVNLSIESLTKQYPKGDYEIDYQSALDVGQYDALGFVRFLPLVPFNPSNKA